MLILERKPVFSEFQKTLLYTTDAILYFCIV